jgi:hypothetical protein
MPWKPEPDPELKHSIPDRRGGDSVIPGYAGRVGAARPYAREPMSRDQAEAIQLALGQVTGGLVPIEKKLSQDGRGYDLKIPAEWFRDCIPGVKAIVTGRRR